MRLDEVSLVHLKGLQPDTVRGTGGEYYLSPSIFDDNMKLYISYFSRNHKEVLVSLEYTHKEYTHNVAMVRYIHPLAPLHAISTAAELDNFVYRHLWRGEPPASTPHLIGYPMKGLRGQLLSEIEGEL